MSLDDVSLVYQSARGATHALDSISLSIADGEFVAVVGASGCGKTTLLHLTAGLLGPTSGMITREERVLRRGGMGMVFQTPSLLPWRSVVRNVLLSAELLHLPQQASVERASDLLQLAGLSGFENALPRELSGGMQQRVSLCRALLSEPPLLLMDEPFGALDEITRESLVFELQRIWMAARTTVVYVTHSLTEAVLLSDRVVVLTPRPGHIAGILENTLPRPRTVATYRTAEFGDYAVRIRELLGGGGEVT